MNECILTVLSYRQDDLIWTIGCIYPAMSASELRGSQFRDVVCITDSRGWLLKSPNFVATLEPQHCLAILQMTCKGNSLGPQSSGELVDAIGEDSR